MKSLLSSVARALGRLNRPLSTFGRNLAAALLAVMLALALAQIVSRGLFHHSLDWAEELARVALVWSVLLTSPYAYRHGAHVAIVSFAEALPPRLLTFTSLLLNLLILWILGVLFVESFAALVTRGGPGGAPRLQIPRDADRYFGVQFRANFGGSR